MPADTPRLAQLAELSDYRIADGDPDPRGWAVRAQDGQRVGRIHDLVVDTEVRKARYLDVLLDEDAVLEHHHHVLVPAEVVRIGEHEHQEREITVDATTEQLRGLPDYQGEPLTEEQEMRYRSWPPRGPERGHRGRETPRGTGGHRG